MNKTVVFLSHITEERDLAIQVKEFIEAAFLGLVDVFVSSDPDSINFGQKWLEGITAALNDCSLELVLCSPQSVQRPWINFEAGAGWVRGIPVVPICHSGIDKSALPIPLVLLQAANLTEEADLRGTLATIAKALGSNQPATDTTAFIARVRAFEDDYTFWKAFHTAYMFGAGYFRESTSAQEFLNGRDFTLDISETATNDLRRGLAFLLRANLLTMSRNNNSTMMGSGMFFGTDFRFAPTFRAKLADYAVRIARGPL